MRKYGWLLAILFSMAACAPRPPAMVLSPKAQVSKQAGSCAAVYPHGRWQFVHLIKFSLPGGGGGTAIGVSVVDKTSINAVLMTVEGFTLFAARYDGCLVITRAVPPFDKPSFGRGLMRDLRLIFWSPPPAEARYGRLADGLALCRYQESSGRSLDVIPRPDQSWEIKQYNAHHREIRTIKAWPPVPDNNKINKNKRQWRPPERLELQARGPAAYTLKMSLISARKL